MKNNSEKENPLENLNEFDVTSHDFIPNTALGQYRFFILFCFVILIMVLVFAVLRFLGFYAPEKESVGQYENPIFSSIERESEIPGVKVYDIRKDIAEIKRDVSRQKKEFNNSIDNLAGNSENDDAVEMMKQKDRFAAEKLDLLRKIENAETKKERQLLIRQLREVMTKKR